MWAIPKSTSGDPANLSETRQISHRSSPAVDGRYRAISAANRYPDVPEVRGSAEAWKLLAHACYQTGDALGEIHAFIERAQMSSVPFNDISNTANRLNQLLREKLGIAKDEKRSLAQRLIPVLDKRRSEAGANDFSRMAWLAIHTGQEHRARDYAQAGLGIDSENIHCQNLIDRL